MKKLYILRHTQKANEAQSQDDYDRELSEEGINDAKSIAKNFAMKNLPIDLIVASPARRTKITAEIFAEALKYDKSLRILKKLNGIKDYLIFAISIIYLIGIIVASLLSANAFYMMFIPVIIIGILQKL